ncbi:hypothetical protein AB1Y20_000360 [Prymnesium parvum]|uniref:Apple domain-containing protein n=1 Tax=Prymnesium parvum TaxID=97485 RepID=A0AB34K958_PRYPA
MHLHSIWCSLWILSIVVPLSRADFVRTIKPHPAEVNSLADSPAVPDVTTSSPPLSVVSSEWQQHQGRCCVQQRYVCPSPDTPKSLCARLSFEGTCSECQEWGHPSDACHKSEADCLACGKGGLYCRLGAQGAADSSQANAVASSPPQLHALWGASPPPAPPIPPTPPVHWSLGRQHIVKPQHVVSCSYIEGVEFVVKGSDEDVLALADEDAPVFHDYKLPSKEKCCESCARDAECVDFVYEYATQACVLLPHVPVDQIDQSVREGVVSGTAKISLTSPPPMPPPAARCTFASGMAYAGGVLPDATKTIAGERLNQHECCSACAAARDCGKFTLDSGLGACTLHRTYAQPYAVDSKLENTLIAGRLEMMNPLRNPLPPNRPPSPTTPDQPMQPLLGAFNYVQRSYPNPPSLHEHDDSESLQNVIAVASAAVGFLVLALLSLCTYCFFAPQLLTFVYHVSNGRLGRMHIGPQKMHYESCARSERSTRKSNSPILKGEIAREYVTIKVTVNANSMTQSKDVSIAGCTGFSDLRSRIFSAFAALKDIKQSNVFIFALARCDDDPPDAALQWLLVNSSSIMELVLLSEALMVLPEEDVSQNVDDMIVAFPKRSKSSDKRHGTSSRKPEANSRPACPFAITHRSVESDVQPLRQSAGARTHELFSMDDERVPRLTSRIPFDEN